MAGVRNTTLALSLLAALVCANVPAVGGAPALDLFGPLAEPFKVTLEAPEGPITGAEFVLTLKVDIGEGYYLYREKMAAFLLAPDTLTAADIRWPAGERRFDESLQKEMDVFPASFSVPVSVHVSPEAKPGPTVVQFEVTYQGCSSRECYPPAKALLSAAVEIGEGAPGAVPTMAAGTAQSPGDSPPDAVDGPVSSTWFDVGKVLETRGLIVLLLLVFISGVGMDFVACIYPMIPVTIAAIGAKENRRPLIGLSLSLCYVGGIVVTFAVLGLVASLVGAAASRFVQNAWTNPWVAGVLAAVFVALGLSMLGLYEIRVPARLLGLLRVKQSKGYAGAFVLGLMGGLIATPCGTPVLAGLLIYTAGVGNPALGALLFGTFGLGIGSVFIVVGTSWGALSLLPKAGGWMDKVKYIFGVLMFVVALWILSAVLPRTMLLPLGVVLLVILVAVLTALKAGTGSKILAAVVFCVAGVLLLNVFAGDPLGWEKVGADVPEIVAVPGKPSILYFTADWCGACQVLKREVFTDKRVIELAAKFRTLMFDGTDSFSPDVVKTQERYGIIAYPTLLFFDGRGRLLENATVIGAVPAKALSDHMQAVLDSFEDEPSGSSHPSN